ncbi:PLP-dependent aminotransferase family protein [Rhodococcus sp. CX]|uniref:aminotransferase-like domain-containing protein n=1 Tax=Rhodococcus sp. CX TaxID=2789880 RepID=UPI0018CF60AC|nr:PLP-dependent aminotransferase family protein [Rhodococcus sp. CX]MBH0121150.1 PLP-dependent aminotransferase family protein [Rhodococcus sp. CX]
MSDDSSSARIVSDLRRWIATAPPGAKLPSTRALVAKYGASPVTVQAALRTLQAQGSVESRPGVGTFVRAVRVAGPRDYGWQTAALGSPDRRVPRLPASLRTLPNDVIALHSGYPDRELLPERLVRSAFGRVARSDAVVGRPPTAGLPELQAWFATELGAETPLGVAPPTPSDTVVVPGSQSGLSAAFHALVGAGNPLLVESPTYWGAMVAAAQAGVQVVPVPSSAGGPDLGELARAFDRTGARVFYAQPNFANPTGAQWSPDLADDVLRLVRDAGAFLVEDDWAHDFGITADPVPLATRDDSGHVVYVRSLTKSVSPAVRAQSMYVSGVLQAVAVDVVTQPGWRTHLRGLRPQLAARRDLLARSLREHAPGLHLDALPAGGLNLWARLPEHTDVTALVRDCEAAGVVVTAGDEWFPAEPTGPHLRMNFSGPDPGAFPDAARIIGEVLERQRKD